MFGPLTRKLSGRALPAFNTAPTNSQTLSDSGFPCLAGHHIYGLGGFLFVSDTADDCWISYTEYISRSAAASFSPRSPQ